MEVLIQALEPCTIEIPEPDEVVVHPARISTGRVVWQGGSQSLRGRPEIVQQYLGV